MTFKKWKEENEEGVSLRIRQAIVLISLLGMTGAGVAAFFSLL